MTLLTGEEQTIPSPERQAFIAAGLAHILAVAGLHVGIVMGLVFAVTRFLLTRYERTRCTGPPKRWPPWPLWARAWSMRC